VTGARALISVAVALVALVVVIALVLSGGGGGGEGTTTTPAPSVEAPGGGATPPSDLGALPPGFVECMAQQGYDIDSSADIHSAPPEVLQGCFGASHQGGG
jgi:hypothetical protein